MSNMFEDLGVIKAQCIIDKKYKVCNGICELCIRYKRLSSCYNELTDYGKLCVDDFARYHVPLLENVLLRKRTHARIKKLKKIFGICIIIVVIFLCIKYLFPVSNKNTAKNCINNVLDVTHSHVKDINTDGMINCIDYAVTFKLEWDKLYSPEHCEIVRNKNNKNNMHHLFNRCYDSYAEEWIEFEPQEYYLCSMYISWGDRYNSEYNIYGETDEWLAKIKTQ